MKSLLIAVFFLVASCSVAQDKENFSEKALNDIMISQEGTKVSFSEIINTYKGKKVVIDVWASWCGDCVKGMPKVKKLQEEYSTDVVYLFLSLDKTESSWKKGIERYDVVGEHFFISSGWKGDFCSSIDLDWIPRYMVVNEQGKITLFKATKATDKRIIKALKNEL